MKTRLAIILAVSALLCIPISSAQPKTFRPSGAAWRSRADMPTPRGSLGVATAPDGKIYALGGVDSYGSETVFATLEEYDPLTDTWRSRSSMPTPRFAFGMAVGNNGRLYAIGGHGSSTFLNAVEEYDPTTDSWQTRAALPTARMDVAAIAASDGKIYAIGGCCPLDGGYLASVEAYDPSSNSWTTRASLPVATCCVSVANSPDGKIYAFGVPGSGVVQSYDPLTDSWSTKASLPTARWYTGAAADNSGRIYVVGGYKDERPQNAFFGSVPTVDAYKLATDSWSPRPNLQYPRYNLGVTMSNGKIYAIGGFQVESMLHVGRTLATVEEASPRVLSTQALVDAVENLRDQGVLNQGQRNALVAKLEAALRKINDGRPDSAAKELEGFIRHVNALVGQGTLSTTQGEAIIGEATDVISELEAS